MTSIRPSRVLNNWVAGYLGLLFIGKTSDLLWGIENPELLPGIAGILYPSKWWAALTTITALVSFAQISRGDRLRPVWFEAVWLGLVTWVSVLYGTTEITADRADQFVQLTSAMLWLMPPTVVYLTLKYRIVLSDRPDDDGGG